MVDRTIGDLNPIPQAEDEDLYETEQDPSGSPASRKGTLLQLRQLIARKLNLWTSGQRVSLVELTATADVYDWNGVAIGDKQSYWLGAAFTTTRTLNAPPDMDPLEALRQQSGEIHGETGAGGSLIFESGAGGWSPDENGFPTIGADTKFTLYYESVSFDGVNQENRIVALKGWSTV